MRRGLAALLLVGVAASVAAAFLVSNSRVNGRFVFESVPANRRPIDMFVDTDPVPGVAAPLVVAQDLMNQWNSVPEALAVFGNAVAGSSYNGSTVGQTFGVFSDNRREIAFDSTGDIMTHFGVSANVLGITLKSVSTGSGDILDFLVVVNTQPGALVAPGTGATAEELFRGTLLHELGHGLGLGHTAVGMANTATGSGFFAAMPNQMPTMFAFRLPQQPQQGGSIEMDDIAGLIDRYPADTSGLGSVSGTVRGLSGAPVNEAVVRVVGPVGGPESHVGVLTNADSSGNGTWRVPNLPPGAYRVILETANGRANIDEMALAGGSDALGGTPFVFAGDEMWEPADTYDPGVDDPSNFSLVQVRAGRDTGSIDFVLNAAPLLQGQTVVGTLQQGDHVIPDAVGGFHFVDYFVFSGDAGEVATISATGSGVTPQLRVLGSSQLTPPIAEALPNFGANAQVNVNLPETGIYTVLVSARATTGNPGGSGGYSLLLQGAGGALPPPEAAQAATAASGPESPAAPQFSSPVCRLPLLQLRLQAPSHEELWVDRVVVRGSGTGNEVADVTQVRLVRDRNGNGSIDGGEPVVATGTFSANNGTVTFNNLALEADAGTTLDLLVAYDITVTSVSSTAGLGLGWLAAAVLLGALALRRRRAVLLLLAAGLVPFACGGGGGGGGCNGPFDPTGAVVTFRATVQPGDVTAFSPTSDPATPLNLHAAAIVSAEMSVSN